MSWQACVDYTESSPAFLIIIGIPLSYSIADGLALGFISYAIIEAFSGRGREISWLTYVLAIVLVLYFVFVRSRMASSQRELPAAQRQSLRLPLVQARGRAKRSRPV